MQSDPQASRNGSPASPARRVSAELEDLRATCRKQARDISELRDMLITLGALTTNNAELFAVDRRHAGDSAAGPWKARLPLDACAPAAARGVVADVLAERVPASVLHDAVLLVSELTENSVRHSGVGPDGELVLRVRLHDAAVRIDVEDDGVTGVPALCEPAPDGGGLGLHIVQALSEAWGIERDIRPVVRVATKNATRAGMAMRMAAWKDASMAPQREESMISGAMPPPPMGAVW